MKNVRMNKMFTQVHNVPVNNGENKGKEKGVIIVGADCFKVTNTTLIANGKK
jgi:hypothetical protein